MLIRIISHPTDTSIDNNQQQRYDKYDKDVHNKNIQKKAPQVNRKNIYQDNVADEDVDEEDFDVNFNMNDLAAMAE